MLASISYVPLLKTRTSEVEAFNFLEEDVKDRCFPVFSLRPWPNANFLDHSVNYVTEALGGRPFGLGLDKDRLGHSSSKAAQAEFDALFNPARGYKAYFDFVESIPNAVPVLQASTDANNLLLQLGAATDLDRGLIVHQVRGSQIPLSETVLSLPPLPTDTVFIVDAAWARDPLQLEAWTVPIVKRIFSLLPSAEIVVAASSFPESFGHIVGDAEELAYEDTHFSSVRQQVQGANLVYGDWGSTRLPQSGGGGKIPPRIDLAKSGCWHIFRADATTNEAYLDVANAAKCHPSFAFVPDCWGKTQIAETDGKGVGITGTKMNTSARINAHMTLRAGPSKFSTQEEVPYQD